MTEDDKTIDDTGPTMAGNEDLIKEIDAKYQKALREVRQSQDMTEHQRILHVAGLMAEEVYEHVSEAVRKIDIYRTARDNGDPLADCIYLQDARIALLKIIGAL